jgi:hypothetical protein
MYKPHSRQKNLSDSNFSSKAEQMFGNSPLNQSSNPTRTNYSDDKSIKMTKDLNTGANDELVDKFGVKKTESGGYEGKQYKGSIVRDQGGNMNWVEGGKTIESAPRSSSSSQESMQKRFDSKASEVNSRTATTANYLTNRKRDSTKS